MRREISGDRLFMALFAVMLCIGFIGAAAGVVWGPANQRAALAAIGGIAGLLLGLLVYGRFREAEREKAPVEPTSARAPRFVIAELFWGVALTLAITGLVLVSGPSRMAWGLLTAMCGWQFVAWEWRRRKARGDADS